MSRPALVTVDLDHLRHNFLVARRHAAGARVLAMVKADAYGHGAVPVARALAGLADGFGVSSLEEGAALRAAGITAEILLVAGCFSAAELPDIARCGLQVALHDDWQVRALLAARLPRPLVAWLKIDTGMHRLGFAPEAVAAVHGRLARSPNVAEIRLMTHFACADAPGDPGNARQREVFARATAGLAGARSLANSAALVAAPESRADWVRPGILLYGVNPFIDPHPVAGELRPVMTLSSRILAVRTLEAGEGTGYGNDWTAPRTLSVGLVAMGYGDGYPRHAPTGTPVLVKGCRTQLVGRVSMDFLAVDLGPVPGAAVGDPVVLWGEGLPAWEVARCAGTIAYELFTGVNARVPVRHTGG
ncbi:MAG: alanine racemase [Pseudomonadota bacterium]